MGNGVDMCLIGFLLGRPKKVGSDDRDWVTEEEICMYEEEEGEDEPSGRQRNAPIFRS